MAKLKKLTFEIDKKDYVLSYDDAHKLYLELNKIFGNTTISVPGKELTKQFNSSAFYYGEDNLMTNAPTYSASSITTSDIITLGDNAFDMANRPKSAYSVF